MSERILCQGHFQDNDTRVTGLNNNDAVIGPSGAGKTRGYVLPNILQCSESLIVTDTKGNLSKLTGRTLRSNGYEVIDIDLRDCAASPCGYNPLMYVRRDKKTGRCVEQDILQIAAALSPVESRSDPFWEHMTQLALSVMISYVLEYLPYREHHLGSVVRLMREMGTGSFDALLGEVCEISPESFTAVQYKMFNSLKHSDRTYACVLGFLAEKLSPFAFSGAQRLFTYSRQLYIQNLGNRKTAVFLNVSDTDRSMDTLASLFYAQALQVLCRYADSQPERRLRVPVRFIMDDFAASSANCIENFDQITSVIRSREISVSMVLQSLSQLEAAYGTSRAVTILNNCDNLLYLGGQDVETARYIGAKANKTVYTILDMPPDSAWLFTRGKQPREVKKFQLESHPRYWAKPEKTPEPVKELIKVTE